MTYPRPSTPKSFLHLLHHHTSTLLHLQSLHAVSVTSPVPVPFPSLLLSLLARFPHLSTPPSSPSYPLSLFLHPLLLPKSTFSFNLIIRSHLSLSPPLPLPALRFFLLLLRLPLRPDSHTFPFTLKALSLLPSSYLPLGRSLHCLSLRLGLMCCSIYQSNSLISMYSGMGSMDDARKVFAWAHSIDVVSYNALIDGYLKRGSIADACALFDKMPERDAVSWGTLLAGYTKENRGAEGVALFDRMIDHGVRPDDVALVSALSCCGQMGALDRGRAIHDYIERDERKLSVYLSTGLVDMYAKCGCIESAVSVFESSPRKNLFTWNAVIVGVAMHGHGDLAVKYYSEMVNEKIRPDGVTFLGVLVACSHSGHVELGKRLFDEMTSVYGLEPELKHYGCMADLLGRSGLIDEAMRMIKRMPMKADAFVWGGVLGGCRLHGKNVEVAEIAMRNLLEIKGEDRGVYSIMVELYSTVKRWDDVERVRRLMNEEKVKMVNNAACSLIEL